MGGHKKGEEERMFYCWEFNRGTCAFGDSHEGRFNRMNVIKTYMCSKCWKQAKVVNKHPEGHEKCPFNKG